MQSRRNHALWGTLVVLVAVAALPTGALAAGTSVSVRIEGQTRTLQPTKTVHIPGSGSITKGGAPTGSCPSTSAAGALNVATKGDWGGSYSVSVGGLELTSIKGENWPFTQTKYYWGIWVNNRFAEKGMCEISLHRGDKLLFAADSESHPEHPVGVSGPARASVGKSFKIKAVWYTDAGKAKALKGIKVDGATTNAKGVATITPTKRGKLRLKASPKGYIRSATITVKVS